MADLSRRNLFGLLAVTPALLSACRSARASAPALTTIPDDAVVTEDEAFWAALREEFLIPEGEAFFNTGTLGASPRRVVQAVIDDLRAVETGLAEWAYTPEDAPRLTGYHPQDPVRAKIAALFGADGSEIALTQNATMGMNFVANGLDLAPGDEILITDQEHPGGRSGWELKAARFGATLTVVEIPLPPESPEQLVELFAARMGPQTKVLAVPHITSGRGIVMPVQALCELAAERGIFTVIDGAQAPGQIRVDLHGIGCDAYFSSPHKWLLAPKGSGFLYVRAESMDRIWTTLASGQWDNREDGAFRLMQFGTGNRSLLAGLDAALDFWGELGPARAADRDRFLADRLRGGLAEIPGAAIHSPTHPDLACAMVSWSIDGVGGQDVQDALWDRERIRVRAVGKKKSRVRQCCHIYNGLDEVERTLAVARSLAAG